MKRYYFFIITFLLFILTLTGCEKNKKQEEENLSMQQEEITDTQISEESVSYTEITQKEAKEIMDTEESVIILDVRTQEEYDTGHIPNAILIPHDQITDLANSNLPDKEQLILVYCRSGNRSKIAAKSLAELGYTNVKEFGGINTWSYDITE